MTKDEALKLALEALGEIEWSNKSQWQSDRAKVAITAIKEALDECDEDELIIQYHEATIKRLEKLLAQPEQEPVARVIDNGTPEGATEWIPFTNRVEPLETGDLLYATPPQRPWVGLTDGELFEIMDKANTRYQAVQMTQAKLRELNELQIDPNKWAFDNGLEST